MVNSSTKPANSSRKSSSSKGSALFSGSSDKELKAFARSEAGKLERKKAYDPGIHKGKPIDLTPEPPPAVIPPTAEKIAKDRWFKDWSRYKEVDLLLKSVPELATTVRLKYKTDLEAILESTWLDNYLGDL